MRFRANRVIMRIRRWSAKSFEDANVILRYLNFLLGLRMWEWPRGRLRPYLSAFYLVFSFAFFIINALQLEWTKVFKVRVLKFEAFLYQGMFVLTTLSLSLLMILGLCNTKLFLEHKKVMVKVEKQLQHLGGWIDNSLVFRHCFIYTSLWFLFITVCFFYYVKWFLTQASMTIAIINTLSYCYGETIGTIVIIDFITTVHWHKLAYEQTNMLLRKGFHKPQILQSKPVVEFEEGGNINSVNEVSNHHSEGNRRLFKRLESLRRIKVLPKIDNETLWIWKIRQIHLELCRGLKSTFNIYGMQMGIEMALTLVLETGRLYYLYIELTHWNRTTDSYIEEIILPIMDCIIPGIKIYIICATCEYTLREIKDTSEILYTLTGGNNDPEFKDEAHQFTLQVMQNEQGFVVHSVSGLSFNFIRVFLRSIVTYLMIMIQMSNTMESNDQEEHAQNKTPSTTPTIM